VIRSQEDDPARVVQTLVEYAERARREGVLALEQDADTAEDPFLRKALQLLVDGSDPEDIRAVMENELAGLEARRKQEAALFETMAQLAPSFGLVGTLVSLVQVFRKMDNPSGLGSAMAGALLATFYGVLLAYLIFQPVAGKLKVRLQGEVQKGELMLEGVLAIHAGDTPTLLQQKLNSFLPPEQRVERASAFGEEE
jgi:chemotaxis protein MotA